MSTDVTNDEDFDVDDPALTRFDLVQEGARRDGVEIVHYVPRFPVPGTAREKRITRLISFLFGLAGLLGVGFVVAYIAWPWTYKDGENIHKLYTPVLGVSMGLSLLCIGFGLVTWGKKLLPEEISVQERHPGGSPADEKKLTGETMLNMVDELGVKRRPLLGMVALAGMAPLAVVIAAPLVGGLIKDPHDPNIFMFTAWDPSKNPELRGGYPNAPTNKAGQRLVALTRDDGTQLSPNDVSVGGQLTVFPGLTDPTKVPSFVGSSNDFADSPTLLIHLRDADAQKLREALPNVKLNTEGVDGGPNMWGNFVAYSKICTHAGCPASLYEQQTNRLLCPCHQSQFDILNNARPIFGPATRRLPMLPLTVGDDGFFYAAADYQVPVGPGFWGEAVKKPKVDIGALPGASATEIDDRLTLASPLRRLFNKVFPDHWSFLLGEIALYSFVVLLLTGTFLAFFFDPSMTDVTYSGSYAPLRGIVMSQAYNTALHISFDVRGGLILRQMHHWAALLFLASIVVHMLRVFFTGAFRKPRELNWIVGILLFWIGFLEGFAGYSLPDDALSGTGLRIASAIMLSIPVVGTWVTTALFGGEFPGHTILPLLYIVHVLLIPALLVGLITVHMGLLVKQKHTQWPGPGRTNENVVGIRMFPAFSVKAGGFFMIVFAMIALLGGLFQINPIWLFGPYRAAVVSAASQPDWYVMFLDGSTRLMPPWEARFSLFGYSHFTIPPIFWPTVVLPGILTMLPLFYPFLEARKLKDNREHHLLQRPRDVPTRTALGAMAVTFYVVLLLSGGNDVIADKFDISLNAMTWAGRIGLLVLPPLAYWVTHRLCLGLQQHDREVLAHGVETGIIKRLPDGRFIEVHQPLTEADGNGHGTLEYADWVVPKKMNRIGALKPTVRGFFRPVEDHADAPEIEAIEEPEEQRGITSGRR